MSAYDTKGGMMTRTGGRVAEPIGWMEGWTDGHDAMMLNDGDDKDFRRYEVAMRLGHKS